MSLNLRNHHKILVVDGREGFTGGMNLGGRHLRRAGGDERDRVSDLHFRLHGPILRQLEAEFLRAWELASGEPAEEPPEVPDSGEGIWCRTLTDGPDEDLDRITMLLSATIAQARERIDIMTPYFLPPREIIGALQAASLRGVEVHLVLPEKNNLPFVHWAMRNMLWEVLYQGVRVHYQPAPFAHGKLFVVDGRYTLIGSSNWDARSLRLNFELQVEVFDADFAERMSAFIADRISAGRPVTLDEVDNRGLPERIRDSLCWLATPYL